MVDSLSQHVKDGSDDAFMADVIEASQTQPVLVDFWAPWCGPCKTLTPIIEKAVEARGGAVKLVKINTEEHPAIAGQLNVRSIPTVYAFDKGQPVDGFMGALPESQVNQFIDKILSGTDGVKALSEAVAEADGLAQSGDIGTAAQIYASVINQDPENAGAIAGLARCYLANGDKERATETLDLAPETKQSDPALKSVRKAIELMADAPPAGEFDALLQAVSANPNDHDQRFELAEKFMSAGRNQDAVDHLLIILGANINWKDGKAKDTLLTIFEATGPTDPITVEGRKRLASVMFA